MYKISQLAKKVGLSRTALLYYEKLQLISGRRMDNGYRVYDDNDVQRICILQQLQAGGLTLQECKACLDQKVDKQLLVNRLQSLEREITQKQSAKQLLSALLGQGDLAEWHRELDKKAPRAHLNWLYKQGFSEKEALRLKWLSKDMNQHDNYMLDFMKIFDGLARWAPGSEQDTKRALSMISRPLNNILEIGSGKGLATRVLVQQTDAQIVAVDNEQPAIDSLLQVFSGLGVSERVTALCASMTELPVELASFDLIWAEGSAYIMGVERALQAWKPFLRDSGYLMFSDLVWHTDSPSQRAIEFWAGEYPDMQQLEQRIQQIQAAGYKIIDHFKLSEQAWLNYYAPLNNRLVELADEMRDAQAHKNCQREVDICTDFAEQFGYQMFVLHKVG